MSRPIRVKSGKSSVLASICFLIFMAALLRGILNCGKDDSDKINRSFYLSNGFFSGIIHDNESNKERQGSGFNPLIHFLYPGQNIYRDEDVGLNFEHIMNGTAADAEISMFTPRGDICTVHKLSDSSASIIHKAKHSSWNIDSEMRYNFSGKYHIDLEFRVILRENKFPLDYVAFMWASYMNRTFDRRIFFIGNKEGKKEWVAFGEDTDNGFETGTIGYSGADHLTYEEGSKTLNIIEHPEKKFIFPFYYGLVHGSGQIDSQSDTMVYIMMFDQKESIRFAMWNFAKDSEGKPDTHSPAWDWQYVIREPQINKEYSYQAKITYKPFAGSDDVVKEYENWMGIKNN
jgi:hypothetical protein